MGRSQQHAIDVEYHAIDVEYDGGQRAKLTPGKDAVGRAAAWPDKTLAFMRRDHRTLQAAARQARLVCCKTRKRRAPSNIIKPSA